MSRSFHRKGFQPPQKRECFFFNRSGCIKGATCRFLHVPGSKQQAQKGRSHRSSQSSKKKHFGAPERKFAFRPYKRKWKVASVPLSKGYGECKEIAIDTDVVDFRDDVIDLSDDNGEFTVMSYNILSDDYVQFSNYRHCPRWALDDTFRRKNILKELRLYNTDIIALQEVDTPDFWKQKLEQSGYQVVYHKRTGRKVDGCIIAFKATKFEKVSEILVEYRGYDSLQARDNIGQVIVLQQKNLSDLEVCEERRICVANTHLIFNPKRGEVKIGQVQMFLDAASKASKNIPSVICGDFNLMVYSPIYKFIETGKLRYNGLSRRLVDGQVPYRQFCEKVLPNNVIKTVDNVPFEWDFTDTSQIDSLDENMINRVNERDDTHTIRHDLDLTNSYDPVFPDGEYRLTSFHPKFEGTVDYIWYTAKSIRLLEILEVPRQKKLRQFPGCPCPEFPSDHLLIASKFCWK